MAQQANITVFDGASTPVSHTLLSDGTRSLGGGEIHALWKEAVATVPDYAQVRITQIKRKLKSGVAQPIVRVEVPVMESISGQNLSGYTAPPKVAFVDRYDLVGYHHERSTEASKRVALQMLINYVNGVTTSVTPVTTGSAADLLQRNIQVS